MRWRSYFSGLFRADLETRVRNNLTTYFQIAKATLLNLQTKSQSLKVAKTHYDAGNELYKSVLDKWMMYSCAYWEKASNLDEAQENKH